MHPALLAYPTPKQQQLFCTLQNGSSRVEAQSDSVADAAVAAAC
jgi:hypothetical protein